MARSIDLNADLGEGVGDDVAMLGVVTSASIATGAHAGGGAVLRDAVLAAARRDVAIGAHPAYRDRAGFGRASGLAVLRQQPDSRQAFVADLVGQVRVVAAEAEYHGAHLDHVKPHGSLYNEAVVDALAAELVGRAVVATSDELGRAVAVMTQPGGCLAVWAAAAGLPVLAEGFADRGYESTGRLVPRRRPGGVHTSVEVMVAQALDLARGRVRAVGGDQVPIEVVSLCLHGDTPGAVAAARAVRGALEADGWLVAAPRRGNDEGAGPGGAGPGGAGPGGAG